MSTATPLGEPPTFDKGLRLHCEECGAEIEIVNPTTANPPRQVFRCCGRDMTPEPGRDVNLGVE
jgi:hypothetical protein